MLASVDNAREEVQSVLEIAVLNASRPTNGAEVLQLQARAALEGMVAAMNVTFNGDSLFAGLDSNKPALTRWSDTSAVTGRTPESVLQEIIGTGPTDAASATQIADKIDQIFQSQDTVDPSRNFEGTFYQGSRNLDAGGQPTKQIRAWVNTGQEVVFGKRANEEAFRAAYQGLAMLAATDVSTLDEAQTQLTDMSLVQRTQISNYESVDPYEAITRMNNLETQLQASYQVTSRLSSLSILNFLR